MEPEQKRLVLALALGSVMAAIIWVNLSQASPLYAYLKQVTEVGYGLLVLNLPALLISRLLSGTPPAPAVVYLTCFLQWFVLGLALSFAIWPRTARQNIAADGHALRTPRR